MDAIGTVGILGAGRAGTSLARALDRAGVAARIASTRSPTVMRLHLAQYAPRATAVPAERIAEDAALVVLMIPQEDLDTVDPGWTAGRVLVDATNRWEDEPLPEWLQRSLDGGLSSSEAIAAQLPDSAVVKALNHISHWDLDTAGRPAALGSSAPAVGPAGGPRRALAVAGNDDGAVARAARLTDQLGYDPVVLGALADGRVLEPGGPVFNLVWTADDLVRLTGGTPTLPGGDSHR